MYDYSNLILGFVAILIAIYAGRLYFINAKGTWLMLVGFMVTMGAAITPKGINHAIFVLAMIVYIVITVILTIITEIKRKKQEISH